MADLSSRCGGQVVRARDRVPDRRTLTIRGKEERPLSESVRLPVGPFDDQRTRPRVRRDPGHISLGRRHDRHLHRHQKRVQYGTLIRDKGRADVEVRT